MTEPTERMRECFVTYAKVGRIDDAARQLGISPQRLKANVSGYYRRIGARSAVHAAYLTWGPKEGT